MYVRARGERDCYSIFICDVLNRVTQGDSGFVRGHHHPTRTGPPALCSLLIL